MLRTLLLLGENESVYDINHACSCLLQVLASYLWKAREEVRGQEEGEGEAELAEEGRRWQLAMLLRQTATLLGMSQCMEPVMQCPPMLQEMTL